MMGSLTHHLISVVTIFSTYIMFYITYCILSTWYFAKKQYVHLIIDLNNGQYS